MADAETVRVEPIEWGLSKPYTFTPPTSRAKERRASNVNVGSLFTLEVRKETLTSSVTVFKEYTKAEILDIARAGQSSSQRSGTTPHSLVCARDLQVLDAGPDAMQRVSVVVRRGTILIALPPLRTLITPDVALFFPERGADSELQGLYSSIHEFSSGRRKDFIAGMDIEEESFELTILSLLFSAVDLDCDMQLQALQRQLNADTGKRKHAGMEHQFSVLQDLENSVMTLSSKVESMAKVVEAVRENEEDCKGMLITRLRAEMDAVVSKREAELLQAVESGEALPATMLTRANSFVVLNTADDTIQSELARQEELLEWFQTELRANQADILLLQGRVAGERKRINLVVATNRNKLLMVQLAIQVLTAACAGCSVVSGFFGMNLGNSICGPDGCNASVMKSSEYAGMNGATYFMTVVVASLVLASLGSFVTWRYVKMISV